MEIAGNSDEYLIQTLRKEEVIITFREQPPSYSEFNCGRTNFNGISADALFSIFTADIIKEQVVFTR